MKDMQAKLTKLLDDANDCDLIGNLATDPRKRATFRRMAHQLRAMAAELRAEIVALQAQANDNESGERPAAC